MDNRKTCRIESRKENDGRRIMLKKEFSNKNNLLEMAKKFKVSGNPIDVEILESGHINKTYKIIYDDFGKSKEYILQYVNTDIFTNLQELMSNIKNITNYIRKRAKEYGEDSDRVTLTMMDTIDNNMYSIYNKNWRMEKFIQNTKTFLTTEDLNILYEAGKTVGNFQKYLDGFDTSNLNEIIPKFHYTPNRLNQLMEALNNEENKQKRQERFNRAKESMDFLLEEKRTEKTYIIINMLESEKIPYRVTHNDAKLSNILFDKSTNDGVCLIDLDTVMPGALAYDFGEGVRTSISLAEEDEQDVSKVNVDLDRFEAFTKGFLENVKSVITKDEQDTLLLGAWMMTYENALRFVTDYLNGDIYFNVNKDIEDHNLYRAKVQIKILKQFEQNEEKMIKIIRKYGI